MVTIDPQSSIIVIDPVQAVQAARTRKDVVVQMQKDDILRAGIDFGIVPGSNKPSLLKPGAERLCAAFHFNPHFETLTAIERWDGDEPLFFYRVLCRLIHIETGFEVATGIGSCNSRESKYRWRWASEADVPATTDKTRLVSRNATISEFAFAVEKAETGGKYGKPAEYWQRFAAAISSGTARSVKRKTSKGSEMDAWEIGGVEYRIPNDDIFSLVNTVDKMACKRALVAATLIGANASEFFTQDIEDMPGFGVSADGDVVEGIYTVVTTPAATAPVTSEKPAATPPPAEPTTTEPEPTTTTPNPFAGTNKRWSISESSAWVNRKLADGHSAVSLRQALGIAPGAQWTAFNGTADAAETAFAKWEAKERGGLEVVGK